MKRYFFSGFFESFRKVSTLLLAFVVIFGFSFGIYTACISAASNGSLMRMVASAHVSIVRFVVVILLPFSIAAVAVLFSNPFLLYVLAFLKAFCYAFCLCTICICFEQSGWLVCFLLLFTDSVTVAAVIFFALRHVSGFGERAIHELLLFVCWCVCVGIVDITVIVPLLSTVLIY